MALKGSENFDRRQFLKKVVETAGGAGAAALTPGIAQSQEKENRERRYDADKEFENFRNDVLKLQGSLEYWHRIKSPDLKKNVGEKAYPELKERIKKAKDVGTALAIWLTAMDHKTDRLEQVDKLYGELVTIEKEVDSFIQNE